MRKAVRALQCGAQATTTAQVITNTYEVNKQEFDQGLMFFRKENYIGARQAFAKAVGGGDVAEGELRHV